MSSKTLRILFVFAFLWASFGAQKESSAQMRAVGLRAVASIFGQAKTPSLFDPAQLRKIESLSLDLRWPMPTRELVSWPTTDGSPAVDTRRADELWHTLRPWQDTERLLEMYQGRVSRLKKFNPGVQFSRLLAGELLLVWQRDRDVLSRSIGDSTTGFHQDAELMPKGDNYSILYPHRTFGTFYTVSEMVRMLDLFEARYPEASNILIGDISFRLGGKMTPHVSHRSGRDIDFSYPRKDEPVNWKRFQDVNARSIDAEQTLFMIKTLIDSNQVNMIFIDHRLQGALVREAKRQDAPQEWINAVFQYPQSSGTGALVRHSKGHINHMHVRFKCQPTDMYCSL